jgi:hypothetical protein
VKQKNGYEWVGAINDGNWNKAAEKYIQGWDIDFSQANDPKYKGGVADRMVTNQEAFKQYANELKGGKTPTTDKKQNNNSGETEKQRCLKMTPLEAAKRPECDKYFKSDYNMDYGYDFSKEFYDLIEQLHINMNDFEIKDDTKLELIEYIIHTINDYVEENSNSIVDPDF